jgi:hypothetical protein
MQPTPRRGTTMTDTAKHTPGPWEDNDAGLIYGQMQDDEDQAPFVCDVCNEPGSGSYTEQEKANAILIAAAPDLLHAAELAADALNDLARSDDGTCSISALHSLRAAIARATGG